MTGTVTTTESIDQRPIRLITFDWLSDASGDATKTTDAAVNGKILCVLLKPDTGGTAPSDLYDVTLTDANSIDLLAGNGANCSSTNTIVVVDDLIPLAGNKLSLTVANGGNAKGGIVYVYIQEG